MAVGLIITLVALFFLIGWMDRSRVVENEFGTPRRAFVVSDAGPVSVTTGTTVRVTQYDSWLLSQPLIEQGVDDDEVVLRVSCPGSFPCRSRLSIEVPPGTELVVIATGGPVQLDGFEGDLTVFASGNDINLGPVRGSARIVSDTGDVAGHGMGLGALTVEVDRASMDLEFARAPESVILTAASGVIRLAVPDEGYRLAIRPEENQEERVRTEIEVDERAEETIAIRSEGTIAVVPFEEDE